MWQVTIDFHPNKICAAAHIFFFPPVEVQNLDAEGESDDWGHRVQESRSIAPGDPAQVFFQPGGMFRGIPRRYTALERDAATPGMICIFVSLSP
jgi:hypothetical protein